MKRKNIHIRNIVLITALFVYCAYCAPNVNLVSPYIVRGFSKTYAASYHPETFTGHYEIKITNHYLEDIAMELIL